MELTGYAASVVRDEPGAFEKFVEEAQDRSFDEMSAAALVLSTSADVQVNQLLGNVLYLTGTLPALEPLALRVAEAFERKDPAADDWEGALVLPVQHEDIRAHLPHRDRLLAAVPSDTWLHGLLLVLDLEPLLVLHPASGQGFEVTIGGLGDNFQLHTLLAYRLVPSLIPGEPPPQSWVEAASVGQDLEPAGGIRGQFELSGGFGETIWNEGRPCDIPVFEGRRVVVLGVPSCARSWNAGRLYPMMTPMVDVTRVLPSDEAASWLAKVSP
ncbi:hypothetical protein SK803_41035 [Lentzea sp. BCCO 10_0856]|uniref:Uncharacterized protein n=1 Tax=Lentzea miocenica TaxID=3095431 RepID=A0ABU4TEM0_9PSEU|nr:hypothetical protein [Lentzea sp. BCCO 10_0856]MDX8036618.1 hypothetical protein [Lentzea sp. BCCO 10_0856]